jgi:hypothetical protein
VPPISRKHLLERLRQVVAASVLDSACLAHT